MTIRYLLICLYGFILVASVAGCSGDTPETGEKLPVDVAVYEAAALKVKPDRWVAGVVQPARRSLLGTRVSGYVEERFVCSGDRVEKGDLLVQIDSRDIAAGIRAAEKQRDTARMAWEKAETDLERARRLYDEDLIAKVRLEEAELQEDHARSRFEAAEAERISLVAHMDYARIRAPCSGTVSEVLTETGSFAGPGPPLIVLEDRDVLEVRASIDEQSMMRLKEGDTVDVYLPGPGAAVRASVEAFIPALEAPGAGSTVRLRLKDPPEGTRPGMVARVRVYSGEPMTELSVVPEDSLVSRGQLSGVFVIREVNGERGGTRGDTHRALLRGVHPAPAVDAGPGRVAIRRGLEPGEYVAAGEYARLLEDDQPVRITDRRVP